MASTPNSNVAKRPSSGLLGRVMKGNRNKDLKKVVKEGGEPVQQGFLKKFKEKDGEWKQRWVELRGGFMMWSSSTGNRNDFKDYIELDGAKLIDECSMFGLDASGQPKGKNDAVVYSVEKGKTKNMGTMKEKMAMSHRYSWRIEPRGGGPAHIFAAEGDHEKEDWWRAILKSIQSFQNSGTKPNLEEVPLFASGTTSKPASIPRVQVEFDFLSVVGQGAYGRVIKVREKATGNIYVCKVLEKAKILHNRMLREVRKEQALLQKVAHPNIVDLISAFQTRDKIFLVMEFLSGGELFNLMTAEPSKRFSVDRARFYAGQLVLAIEYLHTIKIIHCDLKAENCVLTRDGYMKLTDFGFATTIHEGEKIVSRNGTPVYMAPEMIKVNRETGYTFTVDVWSLGVLIYAMLTGYFPFHGETPQITLRYVCERDLAYPPGVQVSDDSRALLKRCLDRNPSTRITSTQMKGHRFFQSINWEDLYNKTIPAPYIPDGNLSRTHETNIDAAREAMVSMHSVHAGDDIFCGFPFVRSNSTKSHMLQSGQIIGEADRSRDDDYLEALGRPVNLQTPDTRQ
eukprot:TRINITY_DN18247_c1_g2_i1.p1 TRINITY_DN18247_c1_g2~~TRINITY_DN18247_c1_g2_i1.p1  ORF type:complete len:595 (+),score=202.26 TRINITY_DN18247_c1_g2_i1:84-1787(+)